MQLSQTENHVFIFPVENEKWQTVSFRPAVADFLFFPIHTHSLGKLIAEFYLSNGFKKVHFFVQKELGEMTKKEFNVFGDRIHFIEWTCLSDMANVLKSFLITSPCKELILNPSCCLPSVLLSSSRSYVKTDQGNAIFRLPSEMILSQRASSWSLLLQSYKQELNAVDLQVFDCLDPKHLSQLRQQFLLSRSFNEVRVEKNTLRKSSVDSKKIYNEFQYQKLLPPDLQKYFPKVYGAHESGRLGFEINMEYHEQPNLAELLLYRRLNSSEWDQIIAKLSLILDEFSQFTIQVNEEAWNDMYCLKVVSRFKLFQSQIQNTGLFEKLFGDHPIILNGKKLLRWSHISANLKDRVSSLIKQQDQSIIHGDFCFSNILYNPSSRELILLDPRGSFGTDEAGVGGDQKYDWAKLAHSVLGKYDYIVNDLFELTGDGEGFQMEIYERPWHSEIERSFFRIMDHRGLKRSTIYYLLGTVFVSLCSLHPESSSRQIAFFLTGLKFFTEAEEQMA